MFSFENLNQVKQTPYFGVQKKELDSGADQITVWDLKQMFIFVNQPF